MRLTGSKTPAKHGNFPITIASGLDPINPCGDRCVGFTVFNSFGLGFSFIMIGGNQPVKQVNGNRIESRGADIFGYGFDIVIQLLPFIDQNNH